MFLCLFTSTLHCLKYFTVCSVSTGRHRHQLVCSPVWLSGCQSIRNCQPPGKIRFKADWSFIHNNLFSITCSALFRVSFKSFESKMNEWIMNRILNYAHYRVHGNSFPSPSCTIYIITLSVEIHACSTSAPHVKELALHDSSMLTLFYYISLCLPA